MFDNKYIRTWFEEHLTEYEADLAKLVAVPSISESAFGDAPYGEPNKKMLQEAERLLLQYGFQGENKNHYLLFEYGLQHARRLGIFSHLDVVPVGNLDNWKSNPFTMKKEDNYFIGRGVNDNKGPSLLILYLLRFLKEEGIELNYNIECFWGINEETGMQDICEYIAQNSMPDIAFTPDANFPVCVGEKSHINGQLTYEFSSDMLINLESGSASNSVADTAKAEIRINPSDFNIPTECPEGIELNWSDSDTLIVEAKGISRHAAFPEGSVNAIVVLADYLLGLNICDDDTSRCLSGILSMLDGYYGKGLSVEFEDETFGKLTLVSGYSRMNSNKFNLFIDSRIPPSDDMEQVIKNITRHAASLGFSYTTIKKSEGYFQNPNSPWIQLMGDIVRKNSEIDAELFYVMGGGTYARELENAVGFGPGDGKPCPEHLGSAHQPNECVNINMLVEAFVIYVQYVLSLNELEQW